MRTLPAAAVAIGLLGALCLTPNAQAQERDEAPHPYVTLEYSVTIDRSPTPDAERKGKPLVPHTESTTRVTLGPRIVEVAEPDGRRTLLDYESGWAHQIDDEAGTYRSTPLIAHFGYVEIEMFNRRKLGGVLAAADLEEPAFAPVELSILFGWPDDRDDADIETVTEDGATRWMLGDDELTRCAPSEHVLDDSQRAALSRFLQRHSHLHWEVRESIVEDGFVPASLRYRWHSVGERAVAEWTLVSCVPTATRPNGIDDFKRTFPGNAVGRLAQRVLAPDDDTPKRLSHDDLLALSNEARDAGRAEDAALLLLESSLQDASNVTPAIRALLADEDRAKRIRAIMGSVTLANSEPEKGIAALDAVDRTTLTHPVILDVFRANGYANLGKTADAVEAFESALTELPWLSAAYNDLGMALHRAFRADEAWLAWEAGRAVGGEHPTWQGVRGLEEHLRDVYGELL